MRKTVLILGATGRLGHALTHAFLDAGWDVIAQARSAPPSDLAEGVTYDRGPLDPMYWSNRYPQVSIVVHAINPHYTRWAKDAAPALQATIAICKALNARLMFPGNVYNFTFPIPPLIDDATPERASTRKGKIRVQLESMLADAAKQGTRSAVLRAGDFIAAERPGTWFDMVITKDLAKGLLHSLGPLDVIHAWQDIDTFAACFAQVAERDSTMPAFVRFNVAGHAITGAELLASTERTARKIGLLKHDSTVRVRSFPWALLISGQWLVRMWREVVEMRGLWLQPHALDGTALHSFLGIDMPASPELDAVVERALRRDPRFQSMLRQTRPHTQTTRATP